MIGIKRNRGFTLIEVTVSIAIMGTLMLVYLTTVNSSYSSQEQSQADYVLRARALKVVATIQEDLRRSGFVTVSGEDYPALYKGNEINGVLPVFTHGAPHALYEGSDLPGTVVPNSDLVFVLPQDTDNDGWPELTSDGQPDWGVAYLSYLLVPGADGANILRRLSSSGASSTIARGVQFIEFDTPVSSAYSVPLGCVRIRVSVIEKEGDRTVGTFEHEVTVRLRNGGLL